MRSYHKIVLLMTGVVLTGCTQNRYVPGPDVVEETFVHRYGVKVDPDDWEKRGCDGHVVTTLKSGVVVTKNYKAGQLDGEVSYTFPHSEIIQTTETYSNGNLIKQKTHYNSGVPQKEVVFFNPQEKKVTTWYETGTPQAVERIEDNLLVEGKYFNPAYEEESSVAGGDGIRINRDGFGQLLGQDTFVIGKQTDSKTYYPDGSVKEIFNYQAENSGEKRTFSPTGEPQTVESWQNGLQQGMTVVYENGERVAECPFIAGKKHGLERRYKQNGAILVEEITWKNGIRQGPTFTYVGDTKNTLWYIQDRQVTKIEYDRLIKFS